MTEYAKITDLIGKTIYDIVFVDCGDEHEIIFYCKDKNNEDITYKMYHEQDCCETVIVKEMDNDLANIRGLVISAEEVSSGSVEGEDEDGLDYSNTWTFYKIQTDKDFINISWLGVSNGYYSEAVDFIVC
jgi:hypothetical protein